MYPLPLLTVYSATKVSPPAVWGGRHTEGTFTGVIVLVCLCVQAFVDFFSRGLQEEYRRQGIIIQVSLGFECVRVYQITHFYDANQSNSQI